MSPNIQSWVDEIAKVLVDKQHAVQLSLCCLIARGHLLIEDVPGVGKTTLARALMQLTGLSYRRVQFTSDLLPSDILGVSVFDQASGEFSFHPGPVFTQLLLVDEINRASPKTQSALLEAMAENQVTVEGQTRALPQPFFVIATQNPLFQAGTFPLPESQLDRFLMRISLGYPGQDAERRLLEGGDPREHLQEIRALADAEQLASLQAAMPRVVVREAVFDYIQRLLAFSREDSAFALGLSTRAAIALLDASKAWALLEGREHVLPEDVQAVLPAVVGHRIQASQGVDSGQALSQRMLAQVPVLA